MSRLCYSLFVLCLAATITACSGSSNAPTTGPITVQIADDPVDPAVIHEICIPFTGITVHYAGDDDVYLPYDPLPTQVSPVTHCTAGWNGEDPVPPVRLDALNGGVTTALVDSQQIGIGRITWIRLHFANSAYLFETAGGQYPIYCPSCEITDNNAGRGFKLNRTFEVTANGLALLIDIDLRASMRKNIDGYFLRPTARVELNDEIGTISGDVHADLIASLGGTSHSGSDETDTGCAVYVFPGDDSDLDDYHYNDEPGTVPTNVITAATVRYNGGELPYNYSYAAGGLPGGANGAAATYRVALTCDNDDPEINDNPADTEDGDDVSFTMAETVEVFAGQTRTFDFSP